ncbi:MAG: hypothetical protein QM686_23325, partial [Herbaspirillum sp.]
MADCTDSSRMRCRLLPISVSEPSATWASEMPSLALRTATSRPRICVLTLFGALPVYRRVACE